MSDLIKRKDVLDAIQECLDSPYTQNKWQQGIAKHLYYAVKELSSADSVVYGKWIEDYNNTYSRRRMKCSVCGQFSGIGGIKNNQLKPFCPNCGAKMDVECKENE